MAPTKSPELAPVAEDVRDSNHTMPTLLRPVTDASNAGTAAAPSQYPASTGRAVHTYSKTPIHRSVATRATIPAATELRVAIRAVAQPMRTVSFAARSAPRSTVKSTLRPGTRTRVVMAVPRVAKVIDDDQPIEAVDRARRAVPDSDTAPGRATEERARTLHRPQGAATAG